MIHQDCVDRVMALGGNESVRGGFVDIFNAISNEADMKGIPSATLVLPFVDEQCTLGPGDWACEIHLVVRKVADDDTSSDGQIDSQTAEEGEA